MTLHIRSRGTAAQQARYGQEIEGVLGQIRPTRTGTIVLEHIERSPHRVTIVPYTDGDRNAEAVPGNWRASGTVGRGRPAAGTGSRVRFSLRMSAMPPNWPQGNPGEVLVHELAHALRQVTGTERYRAGGSGDLLPMASFENVEEFFAAMVASVYSSELRRPPLGNHGQWRLRDPAVLLRPPYSTRIQDFRVRMRDFCADMAGIPATVATFNPFRDVPP